PCPRCLSYLQSPRHHRLLHPFPTRRSSDLMRTFCAGSVRNRARNCVRNKSGRHKLVRTPRSPSAGFGSFGSARYGTGLSPPISRDRKSTRLNSSHVKISYAVFCLKKKKNKK